jgi:hypothetical protein
MLRQYIAQIRTSITSGLNASCPAKLYATLSTGTERVGTSQQSKISDNINSYSVAYSFDCACKTWSLPGRMERQPSLRQHVRERIFFNAVARSELGNRNRHSNGAILSTPRRCRYALNDSCGLSSNSGQPQLAAKTPDMDAHGLPTSRATQTRVQHLFASSAALKANRTGATNKVITPPV